MNEFDTLQGFILPQVNVRGQIVRIDKTYQTIIKQHPYPPMIQYLLGEAIISCLLLSASIKFEGELSLQFQGDKRLPLLLVQCDHLFNVRAFAKYQENTSNEEYGEAFLQGQMALTINQYKQTQMYQSIVPIQSTAMTENLSHYFAQSEQVATKVWLAVDQEQAVGMMVQLMPTQDAQQKENFWEYAVQVGDTMTEHEMLTVDNQTLLYRLYNETEIRLFDSKQTHFRCQCSLEKMQSVVKMLGEQDAQALLAEKGKIEIKCDFCNSSYNFDAIDTALLFRE